MWIVITFDYVLDRKACASHLNDKKKKNRWTKINTLQTYANFVANQHLTFDMHVHIAVHN